MRAPNLRKGLIVKSFLVVVVVGLVTAGLYYEFVKKPADQRKSAASAAKPSSLAAGKAASPALVEKTIDAPANTALSKKDYNTYQDFQRSIALQYYYNNDTGNAERIMNDVMKNVPAGKVASSSYLMMASIQEKKQDVDLQKKYLQLAIDKLKAEANPDQAASEQQVLDGLK